MANKVLDIGGRNGNLARMEQMARRLGGGDDGAPYAVAYAKLSSVTAVVICRCQNVMVVVDSVGRPGQCGVCHALYYITGIAFDAQAHYARPENQREDAPLPPVRINIGRVEPEPASPLAI